MAPRKPELVPAHASAEPSEPSEVKPEDKPREQLQGEQEENPQVVMHRPGRQAADDESWQRRDRGKGKGAGAPREKTVSGRGSDGEETLEGGEGTIDRKARDGFAGGGKVDRSGLRSRL